LADVALVESDKDGLLVWEVLIHRADADPRSLGYPIGRDRRSSPRAVAFIQFTFSSADQDRMGQAIPITGRDSLTFGEATAVLAKAIGRSLRYEAISDEEARERYHRISGSAEETEAHVALWRAIREGRLAGVTHDVDRILGRRPIAFTQWAAENTDSFIF
jgi:uncharacterized protein YbjT (DUF2867 family)